MNFVQNIKTSKVLLIKISYYMKVKVKFETEKLVWKFFILYFFLYIFSFFYLMFFYFCKLLPKFFNYNISGTAVVTNL